MIKFFKFLKKNEDPRAPSFEEIACKILSEIKNDLHDLLEITEQNIPPYGMFLEEVQEAKRLLEQNLELNTEMIKALTKMFTLEIKIAEEEAKRREAEGPEETDHDKIF